MKENYGWIYAKKGEPGETKTVKRKGIDPRRVLKKKQTV